MLVARLEPGADLIVAQSPMVVEKVRESGQTLRCAQGDRSSLQMSTGYERGLPLPWLCARIYPSE
jgi:hypothetical protein